ncbi:hypothetical protein LTR95_007954 [Oleoguttula sp. CCFEE 5521]
MAHLLELSHELLHCIFISIEPTDLAALSRTCRALHGYVDGNRLLHKDIYDARYDPLEADASVDWQARIHDLAKLEKLMESPYAEVKRTDLDFVARQIDELLKSTTVIVDDSRNVQLLADAFMDTTNMDAFLCGSSLFSRGGDLNKHSAAKTDELRQTSARLHCLYGVPIDETVPSRSSFHMYRQNVSLAPSSCTRLQSKPYLTHTFARSKVYDLRQYTEHTLWGPFKDDGSQHVDWEKVEAIMVVLGFNLRKFSERSDRRFPMIWDEPWIGASPNSYVSQPMSQPTADSPPDDFSMTSSSIPSSPSPSLDSQDPYGVTGTWMRVVCFLDYNDLYAFNFSLKIPASEPREPIATEEGMIRVLESPFD